MMSLPKAKTYSYTSPLRIFGTVTKECLQLWEESLDDFEKVSLVFLFDIEINESMIIMLNNIKHTSENGVLWDLHQWAMRNEVKNFEHRLVEALHLIQNKKLVKLLDFYGEYTQNVINPMRKGLYQVCEDIPAHKICRVMQLVKKDFENNSSYLDFYLEKFMEYNVLLLIRSKYISDGTDGPCDFENLVQVLNKMGLVEVALKLDTLEKKWNEENGDCISLSHARVINELDGTGDNSQCMETCQENLTDVQKADSKVCLPYSINPSSMGLCIIVNQEIFSQRSKKTGLDNRYGTNVDKDMLELTFASFGYEVIVYQDLNSFSFMSKLKHTIQNEIRREHSSFILCILSHGRREEVYCTDGVSCQIEDIEKLMLGQTCRTLLGKPKLLIVQACQGQEALQAMEIEEDLVLDGGSGVRVVSPVADLTTFISSYPGYASLRSNMTGSWFIQTLCRQLLQKGHLAYLHDIFISVTDKLNKKCSAANTFIMTPQYKSTNTKRLLLPYIPEARSAAAQKLLERVLFEKLYLEYLTIKALRYCVRKKLINLT